MSKEYINKKDAIKVFEKSLLGKYILWDTQEKIKKDMQGRISQLPTYSFPDSVEDNTMKWIFDENETCSRCGYVVEGDHDTEFKFCPNCGRKAVRNEFR